MADERSSKSSASSASAQYERSVIPEITFQDRQYEMAERMQRSVPEIADLSSEPKHILDIVRAGRIKTAERMRKELPIGASANRTKRQIRSGQVTPVGIPTSTSKSGTPLIVPQLISHAALVMD